MRVLAVIQRPELASSRIRVTDMAPPLRRLGVDCEVVAYPKSIAGLWRLVASAAASDLVWLQKKLPGPADVLLWRTLRVPVVFDFDDAVCFRKEPRWGSHRSITRERRFRRMTGLAAGVTCGNRYLAELVPDATKPCLVYPSPVPLDVPRHDYAAVAGPLVVGWIGGGGNLGSLARVAPALAAAASRQELVLRVISDRPFEFAGLRVENVPWSLAGQASAVAGLDLGLMPLRGDSPFDRGKCSYKVLQYMAAGVAPAADAVGMNQEVIRDDENGRLVPAESGWFEVLAALLAAGRPGLARLGAAGRRAAEESFGYDVNAGRLAGFFRTLLGKS
ncbi:MAG: hypothetical protein SCH98_12250 [Deferrisomatales bacterium]|nr:hypothetical protein [Deferrisomatales bacterium]